MIQRKPEISPIPLHCIFGSHRGSPWKDGLEKLCSFQTSWMDTELLKKRRVPCTNACKTKVLSSQWPPRYIISAWNSHEINLSFSLLKFPVRLCSDDNNDDDDSKWLVYSTVRGFYVYQLQVKPTVIFFIGNTSVSLICPGLFTSTRNSVVLQWHTLVWPLWLCLLPVSLLSHSMEKSVPLCPFSWLHN